MRDQFAGDISDLRKFAFLRAVTPAQSQLGIAWYYNAGPDGTNAGKHVEHKTEGKWSTLDPEVHAALSTITMEKRSVATLERLPFWPENTIFHREPIPAGLERSLWARDMAEFLESCDVVFADPDIGLGEKKEHAKLDEVMALGRRGRPVIIIKFPHRHAKHPQQLDQLHRLFKGHSVTTVRTCVTIEHPLIAWFSIVNATDGMNSAAQEFAERLNTIENGKADVCISMS